LVLGAMRAGEVVVPAFREGRKIKRKRKEKDFPEQIF
jgi:hypothetical protein